MSMLNLVATVAKIGVHGRIFSSDGGRPLPGFIAIKGINSKVQASRAIVDYHSLLAPAGRYKGYLQSQLLRLGINQRRHVSGWKKQARQMGILFSILKSIPEEFNFKVPVIAAGEV